MSENNRAILGVFVQLVLIGNLRCLAHEHRCDLHLGLQDGSIGDGAITSSVGIDPFKARLNGPSAWCFKSSETSLNEKALLTVDMGKSVMVSGIQTQGPPLGMKGDGYTYHIAFSIQYSSTSNGSWDTCCQGQANTFYTDDGSEVTTHGFETLLLAKRIRLAFETSLGWAGEDEKCVRIEVLGCTLDVRPSTEVSMKAFPAGWIEATWNRPILVIPHHNNSLVYTLDIASYNVSYFWSDEESTSTPSERIVKDRRIIIPRPIWGATYNVSLRCLHQGVDLACGNISTVAAVPECSPSSMLCTHKDKAIFRRPERLKACVIKSNVQEGELRADIVFFWVFESSGWVTKETKVVIKNIKNDGSMEQTFRNEGSLTFTNVVIDGKIIVKIVPHTKSLQNPPSFEYELVVVPWTEALPNSQAMNATGYGAFVTDLGLKINIHWEGHLVVKWSPALLRAGVNECKQDVPLGAESESNTAPTGLSAEAEGYTITIKKEDVDEPIEVTNTSDTSIKTSGRFLQLQRHYQVILLCNFKGFQINCASETVYTDLPLKISSVGDETVVYTLLERGEEWWNQQNNCKRGEGNLVTFEKQDKEDELRPVLQSMVNSGFASIWIGMYLCPDNNGQAWVDGSEWKHTRLSRTDTGLSVETCCIKAVWSSSDNVFSWFGESCKALLPAVCQFKPRGLLGRVMNLERRSVGERVAEIAWEYEEAYWKPSEFRITICKSMDLVNFDRDIKHDCYEESVHESNRNFSLANLNIYMEYNITVVATLSSLAFDGQSSTISLRTFAKQSLVHSVTDLGFLEGVWAEKVSNYEENDIIEIILRNASTDDEIYHDFVPARNFKLGGLRLGEQLELILKEKEGLKRETNLTFFAFPPCQCVDCREREKCIFASARKANHRDMNQECQKRELTPVSSVTQGRLDFLLALANRIQDDLWVSDPSYSRANSIGNLETDALVHSPSASAEKSCMTISRSARDIVQTSCEEVHYVACGVNVFVQCVLPFDKTIQTKVGGNWLAFDWNHDHIGWLYIGSAHYRKKTDERFRRDLKIQYFKNPPVLLRNLERETEYSIEFTADLGRGIVSSSEEFDRITAADSSAGPPDAESLLDESITKDLGMSAGWAPTSSHYLSHLICGTLLIVACISTMLLFFATGMFYQDCMAQLGFLFSLTTGYLLLLTAHPQYYNGDKNGCLFVAIFLHASFLCAFLFLTLEAFVLASLLVKKMKNPFERSNWILIGAGLGFPAIYAAIMGAALTYDYIDPYLHNCWLNASERAFYGESVPHGILAVISILLTASTVKTTRNNQPELKDSEIRGRQSDSYKLRWVITALTLELAGAWSFGIAAFHIQTATAHVLFDVFTMLLLVTIILARLWLDETFRSKLNRLCCGTELTYKRNKLLTISARTRVNPIGSKNQSCQSDPRSISATTATSRQESTLPSYVLPNSPPNDNNTVSTVLIKRSYLFNDDN